MLAQAARHGIAGARWVRGDAARLPFASGSFDVVASFRFVRHLEPAARIAVLRELARVSRRFVVVELLLGAGLVWRTKRLVHERAWAENLASRRPSHAQVVEELASAGLRLVRRHALIAGVSQPHVYVGEVLLRK
jgi:hypothetical protein